MQGCAITFSHDGIISYLSAHKEGLRCCLEWRCPQPASYCHPDSFSGPNPMQGPAAFPSGSCPQHRVQPCLPHFAPAVYISRPSPQASFSALYSQDPILPRKDTQTLFLCAQAAGRLRPSLASTAHCGTCFRLFALLSRRDGRPRQRAGPRERAERRGRSRECRCQGRAVAVAGRAPHSPPAEPGRARPAGRRKAPPAQQSGSRGGAVGGLCVCGWCARWSKG